MQRHWQGIGISNVSGVPEHIWTANVVGRVQSAPAKHECVGIARKPFVGMQPSLCT